MYLSKAKMKVKRAISVLIALVLVTGTVGGFALSDELSGSVTALADGGSVESAITWALTVAADNTHGYSQSDRWGPDYDCSSFVISAFAAGGFAISTGSGNTSTMKTIFGNAGFTWIDWTTLGGSAGLQRGDILLKVGQHTEIVLGDGTLVGAHQSYGNTETGDQNCKEISIVTYYDRSSSGGWDGVLRYSGSDAVSTTAGVEADGTSTAYQAYSTDYAGTYVVNTVSSPLNLRSAPDTSSTILTTIPKGSTVTVVSSDGTWAYCYYGSYRGYCSMEYLSKQDDITVTEFEAGDTFTVGKYEYEVLYGTTTESSEEDYEVIVTGWSEDGEGSKTVKVHDTVTYEDVVFRVTGIAEKAFWKDTSIKKLVVGKYVDYIGAKAFFKCTNLKMIKFNGKKLYEVGSKAFKKTWYRGIKVTAPTIKKLKKYKKLLKAAGVYRFR